MSLNPTNIEWTGRTWNPVTGCRHECWYCYAKKVALRFGPCMNEACDCIQLRADDEFDSFAPTFHPARLKEPGQRKTPTKIFVCSMADLMGEWVPSRWIKAVIDTMKACPQHTFQLLTKNPKRYLEFEWPSNCWLGATATYHGAYFKAAKVFMQMDPPPSVAFVSAEPLLGELDMDKVVPAPCGIDWVIVGALTGPKAKQHQPPSEKVQHIIDGCRASAIPVFLKDNLGWPEEIKEMPA